MKFLLDTSVFLWSLDGDYKLNTRAKQILIAPSQELFLSAVSAWEIAIKFARDSLPLPKAPSEYISVALRTWGLRTLDITHEHALRAGELPAHHRDRLTVCS
jgi:PIN domain nuclease of toxin-antitoxin system